jgi:4'-phosphopantetheinyl transferase
MAFIAALHDAMPTPDWSDSARDGVLAACLACDDWKDWIVAASSVLGEQEVERVRRKRRPRDREATTFAYACHRLLLSNVLGCAPQRVPLYRDDLGCPRLRGGRLWTSLSHADGLVAIAVSAVGPVGIDIESIGRAGAMPEIIGRIVHPDEQAGLPPEPGQGRNEALLALWVRKEALLKAAGIGLAREMNSFVAPAGVVLRLPEDASPAVAPVGLLIRMLDGAGRAVAAIAGPAGKAVASAWLQPPD